MDILLIAGLQEAESKDALIDAWQRSIDNGLAFDPGRSGIALGFHDTIKTTARALIASGVCHQQRN